MVGVGWNMRQTAVPLTVGDVRRGEAVVHEDTVGFCHFQVDYVWGVFQGSHGMLVGHLLQTSVIPLHTHAEREREREREICNGS